MIVGGVRLRNFCQHESLDVELTPGLNMIIGPNGSGKTNFLRGLQLVLIGDAGGNRNKAVDIRQGGTGASYVEADISHGGLDLVVRRGLSPAQNTLQSPTGDVSGFTAVNNSIFQLLGVTKRQIQDYVFVGQRAIDSMFDQQPAERAASLAALFGLAKAETVWKKTGDFVSGITVPSTTISEDALQQEIEEHVASRDKLQAKIAELSLPEDIDAYVAARDLVLSQRDEYDKLQREGSRVWMDVSHRQAKLQPLQARLCRYDADLVMLADARAAIADEVSAAHDELRKWATFDATKAARDQLQQDWQAHRTKWQGLEIPPEPRTPSLPRLTEDETTALEEAREQAQQLAVALKAVQNELEGDCPTCGRPMPGEDVRIMRANALQAELKQVFTDKSTNELRDADWRGYDLEVAAREAKRQQHQAEQQALHARDTTMGEIVTPVTDRRECTRTLSEDDGYATAIADVRADRSEDKACQERLTGEMSQLQQQVAELEAKMKELPQFLDSQVTIAKHERYTVLQNRSVAQQLEQQVAVANANIQAANKQLGDVRQIRRSSAATTGVRDHFDKVRGVFHRNEAPRIVSYTYVETMLEDINTSLELLEATYRVEMDEHLGFNCIFLDGVRRQPDRNLSVGERIVLAMAFRITVNATFAGQVGMLVMDEPTAGLDEQNMGCLPRALDRLRGYSQERGLQVLFVTHDQHHIGHAFDNHIELASI